MKTAQLILYNQIHTHYLQKESIYFIYIHNIGKIKFQGKDLNLNTYSQVLSYACGKNFIEELQTSGKESFFIVSPDYISALLDFARTHSLEKILLVEPTEHYVFQNFQKIQKELQNHDIILEIIPDTQSFLLSHSKFKKTYPEKAPIMEYFYRFMRKKFDILMEGTTPVGGEWNYDKENRKWDKNHIKSTPDFVLEKNSSFQEACTYYNYTPAIIYPSTRSEALALLEHFISHHLDSFGKLEDAMYTRDLFVHHSLLSPAINMGLLSPAEVIERVLETGTALNNKEGFIRQILGWREYMYHFFQLNKETLYDENYFAYDTTLPAFFRGEGLSDIKVNCLKQVLQKVDTYKYSHHIERLMVIGNFTLLYAINPHEVNRWFFESYIDAFEWVVTPNVLSMSQYADGGKLATKPYVSSANYINSMSDYCGDCFYDPKEKYGEKACPYNLGYWSFLESNKDIFIKGRQGFILKNLEKIDMGQIHHWKQVFQKEHL